MKTRLVLISVILISISEVLSGQGKSFTIIQITDPQLGAIRKNASFSDETVLFTKAVDKINNLKPEYVIITGDMVNDRKNQEQWNEFFRIKNNIDPSIKIYYSPGNHDINENPKKEDIAFFDSLFKNDRFSIKYGKYRFIGINSCLIKSSSPGLVDEQLNWLTSELKKSSKAKLTMIFTHYPLFIKDPEEAENYSNIKPEIRKQYLELFSEYGVDVVFSGHLHYNAGGKYKETEYIITSAVGRQNDAQSVPGMRLIKITGNSFTQEYVPLD